MKKRYQKPQLTLVPMTVTSCMLAGSSNLPQELDNGLFWDFPGSNILFGGNEIVA